MTRARERGFTVVELLVAVVLFTIVGLAMFGVVRGFAHAVNASATARSGTLSLEADVDDLRSGAATAFAVFVPDLDVYGRPNARPAHEVDFYSKTDDGRNVFWAYVWDARARTLRRVDYDLAGHVGYADRATGTIAAGEPYPALTGVTAFEARDLEANALIDPAQSRYAAAIAPLFARAGATPQPLPVGYDVGPTTTRPSVYGGNTTVEIVLTTTHGSRVLHLATSALPSGFTIRSRATFRGIVYRVDSTHRSCGGLCQRSEVYIKARLLVSYDRFQTQQTWCDWAIYGYPGGLVAPFRDGVTDYHPDWFVESTAGLVYAVTHHDTPGSTCPDTPPSPPPTSDANPPPPSAGR